MRSSVERGPSAEKITKKAAENLGSIKGMSPHELGKTLKPAEHIIERTQRDRAGRKIEQVRTSSKLKSALEVQAAVLGERIRRGR